MTKRERYLLNYPKRIALKRLKRRRKSHVHVDRKRVQMRQMRKVLSEFLRNRPQQSPIRAGQQKKWHDPLTKWFRKPMV